MEERQIRKILLLPMLAPYLKNVQAFYDNFESSKWNKPFTAKNKYNAGIWSKEDDALCTLTALKYFWLEPSNSGPFNFLALHP